MNARRGVYCTVSSVSDVSATALSARRDRSNIGAGPLASDVHLLKTQ